MRRNINGVKTVYVHQALYKIITSDLQQRLFNNRVPACNYPGTRPVDPVLNYVLVRTTTKKKMR